MYIYLLYLFCTYPQCDKTCGEGIQQRLVRCQDHLGQTLPDTDCPLSDRPHNVIKCSRQTCQASMVPRFHWRKSSWSPVSIQSYFTSFILKLLQLYFAIANLKSLKYILVIP